ncbi:VWA domain-containing protein [Streptomyces sp. NPDC088810]|uniref:VWA domain-containing protein n=1 Tax=Streptomyces sp. NPDC088810 TaxID=3365904 RepID=UPI00380A44F8
MGILTLLRNAFGRSRKSRATAPEGATPVPDPRQSPSEEPPSEEHDLVAAAFDNVAVPHQPTPPAKTEEPVPAKAEDKPEQPTPAEAEVEEKPEEPVPAKAEEKAEGAVSAKAEAEAVGKAEQPVPAKAEVEPEQSTPVEAEVEVEEKAEQPVTAEAEARVAAEEARPPAEADAKPEPRLAEEQAGEEPTETAPEPVTTEAEAPVAPEPVTVEAAEPQAEPEPVTAEEAKPQADAEAEAEPAEATTVPQAADGEDTPQGPPAPDNATRTGGAGGNKEAEGAAEAEPQAPQAEPEAATTAKPATTLARVKARTPALATAYKAAAATLKKTNLTGTRAKLYLVLDRSASMRPYYKDGSAQALADQTLALAAHLDPEATVHVVFFSTEVDGTTDLTLTPDHETKIDDVHAGLGRMGRTSYHAAVDAVLTHHRKNTAPATPALVVFQTDGAPDAKTPATQALTEAAESDPSVFFSFVAFGDHGNKAFDYLRKLKTANTSFFHAGPTPRELTDTQLYEGVLANWRP